MKNLNTAVTLANLTLGAMLAATAPHSVSAHGKDKHIQNIIVTVDGSGYHPSVVNLKAGKPVHITFVSKGESCANGIRIPSLKKSIDLKKGQKKEIVFTPKKGQTISFACKMNMLKGKVMVK